MSDRLPPVEHEGGTTTLRVPDVVSSLNKLGSRGNWRAVHHEKKRWQGVLERYLMMARLPRPLPGFLVVTATLVFPTLHGRDSGNYQAPLEKALGDALQNGGWLENDTPAFWDFRSLEFAGHRGAKTTIINMEYGRGEK